MLLLLLQLMLLLLNKHGPLLLAEPSTSAARLRLVKGRVDGIRAATNEEEGAHDQAECRDCCHRRKEVANAR